MKPFNLEEAKAGKPIVNKSGSRVKFIAFEPSLEQPLMCLVDKHLLQFNADGQYFINRPSEHDLFMAPGIEREGWVNIYPALAGSTNTRARTGEGSVWTTQELANLYSRNERIACVRIEWEE